VLTGDFSIAENGTDRYALLQQFDNIANTSGVNTPGHMNYNPFGLAFVDPAVAAQQSLQLFPKSPLGESVEQANFGTQLMNKLEEGIKSLLMKARAVQKQATALEPLMQGVDALSDALHSFANSLEEFAQSLAQSKRSLSDQQAAIAKRIPNLPKAQQIAWTNFSGLLDGAKAVISAVQNAARLLELEIVKPNGLEQKLLDLSDSISNMVMELLDEAIRLIKVAGDGADLFPAKEP
jgi:hypothetical protein